MCVCYVLFACFEVSHSPGRLDSSRHHALGANLPQTRCVHFVESSALEKWTFWEAGLMNAGAWMSAQGGGHLRPG